MLEALWLFAILPALFAFFAYAIYRLIAGED
jgi:hypothetical protein